MKEHPIIFSTDMIKAILGDRKTMTRRIVKGRWIPLVEEVLRINGKWVWDTVAYDLTTPYGQVSDRLWVRETFCKECYKADGEQDVCYKEDCQNMTRCFVKEQKWTPSIFMPRWASRITLEITEVRVERLQEISNTDCEKEGLDNPCGYYCDETVGHVDHQGTINNFAKLWNSLNAKRGYGWDNNPWVWVISFKVV